MAMGKLARTLGRLGRAARGSREGRSGGHSPKRRLGQRVHRFEPLEDRHLLSVSVGATPQHYFLLNYDDALWPASAAAPVEIAYDYLAARASDLGLEPADVTSAIVTDTYENPALGITHVYLRQTYQGVPVVNSNLNVNIDGQGRVVSVGGDVVTGLSAQASPAVKSDDGPDLSATRALSLAAPALGFTTDTWQTTVLESYPSLMTQPVLLQDWDMSLDAIPAELTYVATDQGMRLAWQTVLRTPDGHHWYNTSIDASTGAVLRQVDWVSHASYNVFAIPTESPDDGSRTLVVDPALPSASPYGWHDTNGQPGAEYVDTRGNNVFAQDDADGNDTGGSRPSGGLDLVFDFPFNTTQAPSSYRSAATTNLFYWSNISHDIFFQYGFTEVAGNFQQLNYSGEGLGGDPVIADSQDLDPNGYGPRIWVPPDGLSPRMQMTIFTAPNPDRDSDMESAVIVHEYGHGVSTRLVGGPSNVDSLSAQQSGAMGEGWSDYFSLAFTQKPTDGMNDSYYIGSYVTNNPAGIRKYPYSFDLVADPRSYGDYNTSPEVHDAGEIWGSALWDLHWLLIQRYGFSPADGSGNPGIMAGYNPAHPYGNTLSMQLVLDSMKLMPVSPTFLDGRDAMLQADQLLTGGQNRDLIWTAFARRGMGIFAEDGGSADAGIVVDDKTAPSANPMATLSSPTLPLSALSQFTVRFSEPMDTASFVPADDVQQFLGPGGIDLRSQVIAGTWVNATTLVITCQQQDAGGQYTLVLGPNILALDNGNPMDQNGNGTPGEAGDALTVTIDVVADAFGYRITSYPVEDIDLEAGQPGVVAVTLSEQAEGWATISLGANRFRFYDREYTATNQLYVYANGFLTLGGRQTGDNFTNGDLTAFPSRATIAPLWDDLDFTYTATTVLYKFDADRLIIEWSNAEIAGYPGMGELTFQAILQLNTGLDSGNIIFNYPDLQAGPGSEGVGATVGIKDTGAQGNHRLIVSQDQASNPYVGTGKAVRILRAASISGQVRGTISGTESGLAGWAVYLDTNNDGSLGAGEVSVLTDANGNYLFPRLPFGTYTVREVGQVGWTQRAPTGTNPYTVTVLGGQDAFGYLSAVEGIVRIGTTATARVSNHRLTTGDTVTIQGAGQSQYNGTFAVTVLDTDTFSYTISGTPVTPATGTITAARLVFRNDYTNRAPVADATQTFSVNENLPLGAHVATISASDPDGDAIRYAIESGNASGAFLLDENTGQITVANPLLIDYETNPTYTLVIRVEDAVNPPRSVSVTANINLLNINDFPKVLDHEYETAEGSAFVGAAPGLLTGASDQDGDSFVAVLVQPPLGGSVTVNPNGSFVYVPNANFVGVDQFTFIARDSQGGESRQGLVSMKVGNQSLPPITLTLTSLMWEGQGAGAGQGTVSIASPLAIDLVVQLSSSDTTELLVPASVTIRAGQTQASFSLTAVDDLDRDGNQNVTVLAWAAGYKTGIRQVTVGDDELVSYYVKPISSPQIARVVFLVELEAHNINGQIIETFGGSAHFTATTQGNLLPGVTSTIHVPPGQLPPEQAFQNGVATFDVTVPTIAPQVELQISDGFEIRGRSNLFDATYGAPDHFRVTLLGSAPTAGVATSLEVEALDQFEFRVENYAGTPLVKAWTLRSDSASLASPIVISECGDTTPDFVEIQNVSGAAVDTRGWRVLLNDPTNGRIADVFTPGGWMLGDTMAAGSFDYRSDDPADAAHYLGGNLNWGASSAKGWAMIIDNQFSVRDFVAWGYDSFQIANLTVTLDSNVVVLGPQWAGAGVAYAGGSGLSLQRMANRESNTALDFAWLPTTLAAQNVSLVLPFQQMVEPVKMGTVVTSMVRAGSVVTVTIDNGHGLSSGTQVWIQGADQPEYNGLFKISVVNGRTFTYVISGTPNSPATGRISVAPATMQGFFNGIWSGHVTFVDAQAGVFLQVNDGAGHIGETQTFSVAPLVPGSAITGPGLYDPAAGLFYLKNSNQTGNSDVTLGFGAPASGWIPLTGDWNGDDTDTIGLFDPTTSLFYLRNSNTTGIADVAFGFGAPGAGWIPIVGDWDGNGVDTVGLYDSINATFYLTNSPTGGMADLTFGFGPSGNRWTPVSGNWEDGLPGIAPRGDGIGLYDPANSVFYLRHQPSVGMADITVAFGAPGWKPLVGDWNGDGEDSIGLYDPSWGLFYERNANTTGYAEVMFGYGPALPNWVPLTGDWTGPASLTAVPGTTVLAAGEGTVDTAALGPIVAAAATRWSALELAADVAARLAAVQYVVTDLPGAELGRAAGTTIYLDRDAAGQGWFVDATPGSDEEYAASSGATLTAIDPAAAMHIDLLTVVMHELGHVAGLEHVDGSDALMSARLPAGMRRIAGLAERDALFARGLDEF